MEPIKIANRTALLEIKKLDADGWAEWHYYARFSFMPDQWFEVSAETYDEMEKRIRTPPLRPFQLVITEME